MSQLNHAFFQLFQSTMPILFVDSSFLGLCNLPPPQIVQYLCFLEPQLPTLSQMLYNLLNEMNFSDSTILPPPPTYFYQKYFIKRKDSNISSEDLAKVNGFILATIFYAFHKEPVTGNSNSSSSGNVGMSEQEKLQEGEDRYSTEKQVFLQRYSDLLQPQQTSTVAFSDLEIHFLVNYEYVIRWIYENIFSQGKQVNQEYVMIAGMALEGSHRIWARGGGSRSDRKVREEIYRRMSGKRKHKRTNKKLPPNEIQPTDVELPHSSLIPFNEFRLSSSSCSSRSASFSTAVSDNDVRFNQYYRKHVRDETGEESSESMHDESSEHWRKKKMKLRVSEEVVAGEENDRMKRFIRRDY